MTTPQPPPPGAVTGGESPVAPAARRFAIEKPRTRVFGLTLDECIQGFFGGSAAVAVVVLALITFFLFREGSGFLPQNRDNLRVYRAAGLEYVQHLRGLDEAHLALGRYLQDTRLRGLEALTAAQLSGADVRTRFAEYDAWAEAFGSAIEPVRALAAELGELAVSNKTAYLQSKDLQVARAQLLAAGKPDEAAAVVINEVDFAAAAQVLRGALPSARESALAAAEETKAQLAAMPEFPVAELRPRMARFRELTEEYLRSYPPALETMAAWQYDKPVGVGESLTAFIFGREWLTASFWQDWYGIVPLFSGSLLISMIALALAVPFGVGAAVYINQLARSWEQRFIKPAIEFISAIPSVVLGFFGIAVLGDKLRALSGVTWLDWWPGFPFVERLNALTAGCLLALLAVPTIFTLAEDALNNVPRAFKEASFALGATRLQTTLRVIIPAALSGIISAVLLGLGRVIGETMVVLLCAGNRIEIPNLGLGLGVATQPVHTMTGIIAQEMGEVARGSIHYRALFCVGIVLFLIALTINFVAQRIVRKYKAAGA
jgi:phosphate transport system permease protein